MTTTDTHITEQAVTSSALRQAAGQFATGITVVSLHDGNGVRGMTANSFTSVSLDPPLILVSVDVRRSIHALFGPERRFVVSVLASDQQALSDRFARSSNQETTTFHDIASRRTHDGLPLLDGALAHFVCRLDAAHPAGDHTLFIGLVEHVEVTPAQPLLYVAGQYRTLGK